jgi:hypothetical protein
MLIFRAQQETVVVIFLLAGNRNKKHSAVGKYSHSRTG